MKENLLEEVSKHIHEKIWMRWTSGLMKDNVVSSERIERWKSLHIPYDQLSEEEKEKDREIARELISLIGKNNKTVYVENY